MKKYSVVAGLFLLVISGCGGGGGGSAVTTSTATDTTAPVISNINASATSDTAGTVTWDTDEASTSQVKYGTSSSSLDQTTTENTTTVTSHSVSITGLTANTQYFYQVVSKDAAGNSATSP